MRFRAALIAALLSASAQAAPAGADLERAATRVAQTLDGVLRNCPAVFAKVGTDSKRCVGSGLSVEQVRVKLGAALGGDLYGVWRSRDEQRSVYNWIRTPAGFVYLRLQADPDGRAKTLVYLDVPLESSGSAAPTPASPASPPAGAGGSTQIGSVTLTPAAPADPAKGPLKGESAAPAPAQAEPAKTEPVRPEPPRPGAAPPAAAAQFPGAAPSLAPVPFRRVLQLQAKRLNGSDVVAVQNRLISLMRPRPAGRGDGWYGPITAATVRAFQKANGLIPTGRVDQRTWDALFSPAAKTFSPPDPA